VAIVDPNGLPECLWSYYIYDMSHVYEICDIFTRCVTYLRLSECLWYYYMHDMCDIFTKHVTYWRKMWHIYDYQSVCGPTHGSCCGMSKRGDILTKDEPYWQLPKCVWSHPRILPVQRCPAWLKLHQNPRLSQFCYPQTHPWVVPLKIWNRTSSFSIVKLYSTFIQTAAKLITKHRFYNQYTQDVLAIHIQMIFWQSIYRRFFGNPYTEDFLQSRYREFFAINIKTIFCDTHTVSLFLSLSLSFSLRVSLSSEESYIIGSSSYFIFWYFFVLFTKIRLDNRELRWLFCFWCLSQEQTQNNESCPDIKFDNRAYLLYNVCSSDKTKTNSKSLAKNRLYIDLGWLRLVGSLKV